MGMRTAVLLAAILAAGAGKAVVIVAEGQPKATIVVPADAPPERQTAAALLRDTVRVSTGAELPIANQPVAGQAAIHLGRSSLVDGLKLGLEKLDDDGYVLVGRDANTYVVAGPTEWGTEFGVVELLERYLGVRWLLPGEHGTDIPRHATVDLPATEVREEPAYFSRLLSGLRGEAQGTWARRNRMHGRVSFHHNLLHLIKPSKYVESHPEFFPVYGGKRYLPTDDDHRWQPNLSAPGIVEESVKNIVEFFNQNPTATSYSLGMNDTSRWDESPESLARESGQNNFLGQRDVSESYYRWANEVVEGVLKVHPDKWFGLLAYNNVAEPPKGFKVHPRIIPYLTYDRMKWVKPELEAQGHELTERWQAQSPTLGWYDYAYGSPYAVPRVYPHQMAKYLRYGRDHGVRAHYAEIYPNWGEGPKPYIFLQLQWNPDLDVDRALEEWYERTAGPAAGQLLKEYYAIWERFWTETAPQSRWWTDRAQYLSFSSPLYLADVKEADVRRSRQLLDEALAKAQTLAQKARVGLLRDALAYYEASVLAYQTEQAGSRPIASEAEALAALDSAIERLGCGELRQRLITEWEKHPVLVHPLDYVRYPQLAGGTWGAGAVWRLFDWAHKSPALMARIEGLAASDEPNRRAIGRSFLAVLGKRGESLAANGDFEQGAKGWGLWRADVGTMEVVEGPARSGTRSVLSVGLRRGGPNQVIPVTPGQYVAVARALVPAGQESKGTVAVSATMRGEDNANLPSPQTLLAPVPGEWTTLVSPVTVPEKVNGVTVTKVLLVAIIDGFQPGEKVYVDDLEFYRLPD
ncbi:MAG: DUF4838 domain-containing protein [Armatimonadetes bacterium]|nr:DUF4838 domain-containing protein [Armatimonadota bacterium]